MWDVELICLSEFVFFIRRHVRYLFVFAALYRHSLFRWRETRILRAAFCLLQHVDDILDGDRYIHADPESYARGIMRRIQGASDQAACPIHRLADFVATELGRFQGGRDDPRSDLLKLLETLIVDHRRMKARSLLTSEALADQHRATFFYSLNLLLIFAGARLRADDVSELIGALSWCSPLRDLEADMRKGLINVPREVLEAISENGAPEMRYSALCSSPVFRAWAWNEYQHGKEYVAALERKLDSTPDVRSREIVTAFLLGLRRYSNRYPRLHPEVC